MIAKILAILVVVLIGVIILQPSDFRITRTAAIAAPPPVVFAQVNDPTTKAWIVSTAE